MYFKCSNRTIF